MPRLSRLIVGVIWGATFSSIASAVLAMIVVRDVWIGLPAFAGGLVWILLALALVFVPLVYGFARVGWKGASATVCAAVLSGVPFLTALLWLFSGQAGVDSDSMGSFTLLLIPTTIGGLVAWRLAQGRRV